MKQDETLQAVLQSMFDEHNFNNKYNKFDVVLRTTSEGSDLYVATKDIPRKISIINKGYWKPLNMVKENHRRPFKTNESNNNASQGEVILPLRFDALHDGSAIQIICDTDYDIQNNKDYDNVNIQYSLDNGITWNDLDYTIIEYSDYYPKCFTMIELNSGESVLIKGDNKFIDNHTWLSILTVGEFNISGNLNSITNCAAGLFSTGWLMFYLDSIPIYTKFTNYLTAYTEYTGGHNTEEEYAANNRIYYKTMATIRSIKNLVLLKNGDMKECFAGQNLITEFPDIIIPEVSNTAFAEYVYMYYDVDFFEVMVQDMLEFGYILNPNYDTLETFIETVINPYIHAMWIQSSSTPEGIAQLEAIGITSEEELLLYYNRTYGVDLYGVDLVGYYDNMYRIGINYEDVLPLTDDGVTPKFNFIDNSGIFGTITPGEFMLLLGNDKNILKSRIIVYNNIYISIEYLPEEWYEYDLIAKHKRDAIDGETTITSYLTDSESVELTAPEVEDYTFIKWQKLNGTTWENYSTDTSITVTMTPTLTEYKAVYEETSVEPEPEPEP